MSRIHFYPSLVLLGLTSALSACSGEPVTLTKIYQSGQCAEQAQALRLIDSPEELQTLVQRPFGGAAELPQVDFDSHWVVLAAWGRQPSAGYRVTLVDEQAQIEGDVLELPIAFEAPEPGTMQAQVMTSPCLVVAIPRGSYTQLQVDGLAGSLSVDD